MQPHLIELKSPKVVPACEVCGHTTRLVGLEPSLGGNGEIATYQCTSCANVKAYSRILLSAPSRLESVRSG